MKLINYFASMLVILLLAACTSPTRGDPEYAPALPKQVYVPQDSTGSIYKLGTAWMLHEDLKARAIGDMVIVLLDEKTDAEKTAETGTSKSTSTSIIDPIIMGSSVTSDGEAILENDLSSDHSFSGKGDSKQSNSLKGSITVVVVDVLSNGNLVVQGEKWININQGEEYVRLRGIVRRIDISPDNTIPSIRVANAEIQYSGDSTLDSSNNMGWLAKFFNSPFMPF